MSDPPAPGTNASTGTASSDEPSFEQALARLEALVARLEDGELELEEALVTFEEGVRLSRRCAEQVEAAERRIEILSRDGDGPRIQPFDAPDDTAPEPED